jgi:predicted dehydrogenase
MTMTSLALLGLGRWGATLVRSVQNKSDRVRFVAAISRSKDKHRDTAEALGLELLEDLEAALVDPAIDGIVIATPHSQHAAAIAACRKAGKPAIVEKPFTLDRSSADAALADGSGMVLAAHNRRFLPAAQAIGTALSSGELGMILHMEANFSGNVVGRYTADMWRADASESPAGGLAGSGIHLIDLMIGYAGPISSVFALNSRRVPELPIDDTVTAMFQFSTGASAVLSCVTASTNDLRLKVFGTKGSAELIGSDSVKFTSVDGTSRMLTFNPTDIERVELEAFADAITGKAEFPVTTQDVLNGVSVFEAIPKSLAQGGPVKVD